jgi:hypothetical protein
MDLLHVIESGAALEAEKRDSDQIIFAMEKGNENSKQVVMEKNAGRIWASEGSENRLSDNAGRMEREKAVLSTSSKGDDWSWPIPEMRKKWSNFILPTTTY